MLFLYFSPPGRVPVHVLSHRLPPLQPVPARHKPDGHTEEKSVAPNHVINLWAMLTEVKEITNTVYWIKVTALILTYINSATNPFIYAMAGDDFRTCVKSAFCAAKEKKQPGLTSRHKTPKTTSSSSGRPLMVPAKLRKSPVLVRVEDFEVALSLDDTVHSSPECIVNEPGVTKVGPAEADRSSQGFPGMQRGKKDGGIGNMQAERKERRRDRKYAGRERKERRRGGIEICRQRGKKDGGIGNMQAERKERRRIGNMQAERKIKKDGGIGNMQAKRGKKDGGEG
ncbi:receptor [Branchiostoma belcheri]|nr:receptor [Branchiostoma belcheri]